jgi:RNA polymerase sigma-70 factor (ECF subfamily)
MEGSNTYDREWQIGIARRLKSRDSSALGELYDVLAVPLQRFLKNRGCREYEDVIHETFIAIWQYASTYDEEKSSLKCWVYVIAGRLAQKIAKNRGEVETGLDEEQKLVETSKRRGRRGAFLPRLVGRPVDDADVDCDRATNVLQHLEADEQTLLTAKAHDVPDKEIAEVLNISPGAVRVRLYRLRKRLKEGLE